MLLQASPTFVSYLSHTFYFSNVLCQVLISPLDSFTQQFCSEPATFSSSALSLAALDDPALEYVIFAVLTSSALPAPAAR